MKGIAFLSDIHANAQALSSVVEQLSLLDVKSVVILGDLLTYGCDPVRTLELLHRLSDGWEITLVAGNHDQLYFDFPKSDKNYINRLPNWVAESVHWTKGEISQSMFAELSLKWVTSLQINNWFASHANPKGFGNWDYLEDEEELLEASNMLRLRGAEVGIFGHSHRPKIIAVSDDGGINYIDDNCIYLPPQSERGDIVIVNVGSVGQPRYKQGRSTFLIMREAVKGGCQLTLYGVEYDLSSHLNSIKKSTLSDETKKVLVSFYGERYV